MTKWILENDRPLLMRHIADEQADYGIQAELTDKEKETGEMPRSWLGVPLRVGDRTVGVMSVQHRREGVYNQAHLQLFETLASYAANAVENARLYEGLRKTKEQIQQWNRTLEQKVEARSAELRRERDKLLHFCSVTYSVEKADTLAGKLEMFARGIIRSGWASAYVAVFDNQMEKKQDLISGQETGMAFLEEEGVINRNSRRMLLETEADHAKLGECILLTLKCIEEKKLISEDDLQLATEKGIDIEEKFLCAPMWGRKGNVIGVVSASGLADGSPPSIETARILELYANHGAAVVERFEMDQELHEHSQELENTVRERTRELKEAQESLIQSGKMAAVGQLAAGIAHELNNPLTGILGYSQLLVRETREDVRTRGLERMREEATRCSKIIENLLSFSRQYRPSKQYESINGILARVMRLREYQLKVNGIEVKKKIQNDLPDTMIDPYQIEQVFMNIVNNAEQALDGWSGEKKISIVTERTGDLIRVTISDTGPGIDSDTAGKVFDPFFTTREVGRGAGLGLSISYGIIDRHGGNLYLKDGPGATFVIEIPITGPEDAVEVLAVKPKLESGTRQARVLIVDDEESILNLVSDVVKACGHTAEVARDGKEAFRLLLLEDYDLIISDLKMPGVDGKGLYERLEKSKPHLLERLIFATGDIVSPTSREFLDRTGVRCLDKPFNIEEIEQLITQSAD
jgi:C4-dicarboxylate-specific signal transduction histidine kinase